MNTVYSTTMINTGGRSGGQSVAPDGSFIVDIAPPVEISGKTTGATNPEQLFAAGYSACFNAALAHVMREEKIKYEKSHVTATVHLLKDADGGFEIAVDLMIAIDDFSKEENKRIADLAHQVCPYSKATRGNIPVNITGK